MGLIHSASRRVFRPAPPAASNLVDGGNAYILGSFGSNTATQQALKAALEAASPGTNLYDIPALSAAGWGNAGGVEGTGRRTQVSTASKVYGSHGWACDNPTDGRFGVNWDTGAEVTDMFFRDYARLDTNSVTGGQWKMLRWNTNGDVQDTAPCNMYCAARAQNGFAGDFFIVNNTQGTATDAHFNIGFNAWYEREFRYKPGSVGGTDGIFEQRIRRLSDGVLVGNESFTNVPSYAGGETNRVHCLVIQNYQGNGDFGDGTHPTVVYMDGTYVSNGSQQRVYLGDASTWTACVRREIQKWATWASGRIDFGVTQGWLTGLNPVWGYVFDANGNVNANGYQVYAA